MTRAIVLHEYGGPEKLRWEEVPVGEPGPGEVLVRIHAASIHVGDLTLTGAQHPQRATAVITVRTSTNALASSISVSGTWTGPGSSTTTGCTTDSSGTCSVIRVGLKNNDTVTFTVSGLTGGSTTWDQSSDNPNPPTKTVQT